MEGIHLVAAVPMRRDQVSHGGFEIMIDLAADDILFKNLGRGGLLVVEVHRGGGA
jgi:hypothetical protein